MTYNESTRTADFVFPGSKAMKLSNVSREQAERFRDEHAPEFGKRGLCLHTPSVTLTRGGNHG